MLQFYTRTMLVSLLLFAVLSATMLAIGSAQPISNPMLQGFLEDCDGVLSCWYGIILGTTTRQNANIILLNKGYGFVRGDDGRADYSLTTNSYSCYTTLDIENDIVQTIHPTCNATNLGDLISILGNPNLMLINGDRYNIWFHYPQFGTVVTTTPNWFYIDDLSLWTEAIYSLSIIEGHRAYLDSYSLPWHGFVSDWRYCQLEPLAFGC